MRLPFPSDLQIDEAVISTLAFFHQFGVPLTQAQILEHLFFLEQDAVKIEHCLQNSPKIHCKNGYYSLKGDSFFYLEFEKKLQRAQAYWKRVNRSRWLFSLCPFVELVAVCNSMAFDNVEESSDIDLLVITKKDRLFAARFFLTVFTQLLGVRRHGRWRKKRFCLSFYLSEEALNLEPVLLKPYDLYFAYWLKTLLPISGEKKLYEALMEENSPWMQLYFKTISFKEAHFRSPSFLQSSIKRILERLFGSVQWEQRFKKLQWGSILAKQSQLRDHSGSIANERMLKFHNEDKRAAFRSTWEQLLSKHL